MDVIYALIPGMIFFGLVFIAVMFWAIKRGQYEDLEGDGNRILMDRDDTQLKKAKPNSHGEKEQGKNFPDFD